MKNLLICLISLSALFLSSCLAPVNSVNDNAKMLKKKEVKASANYTNYYFNTVDIDFENKIQRRRIKRTNTNYGAALAYGVSEKYNIGIRYERLGNLGSDKAGFNYFEINNKIRLKKDKIALSLPLGMYTHEDQDPSFVFDPRLILTHRENQHLEFNVIPKLHIFMGDDFVEDFDFEDLSLLPGLSASVGFSKDLDKWAIRPEVGYDGYWSWGIGFSKNFNFNKDK